MKIRRSVGGACRDAVPRVLAFAAMLALAISVLATGVAHAQASGPTVLTAIQTTEGAGETRLMLTFNQTLPMFSIVSNDNEHPILGFAGTVRGAGANVAPSGHGPVSDISLEQNGIVLTVRLKGAVPLHVDAVPAAGGLGLTLVVTEMHGGAKDAIAKGGPLAQFSDPITSDDLFEVVPLRYADVSEVVGLIGGGQAIKPNDSFAPQEPAFGSSGLNNNGLGGNYVVQQNLNQQNPEANNAPYGQLVDEAIGVDRRLNAIILRGPAARIAALKAKIAKLDVPVTSVLLETVFVELTETGARNVGFDYNNSNGKIAVATYQSGNFNTIGYGSGSANGSGQISTSLQAAIYAQVLHGEGRILSRPRISAQSGSQAKIITGDALPILTSIALSGVNAVSQQVQYVNVGVTLQIAPRVSADGFVTSHIFCVVSSVTGYSQGYPTISQREASTSATVKDGEFFVVGGLTQENELTNKSHVPVAGRVPLIGELFKLRTGAKSKTQLYIVVTPHIVQRDESAAARTLTEK